MDAELAQRIYVQVALGRAKDDAPWPLDEAASAFWDRVEAEVAEIRERGGDLEVAELGEIPDLPPWVKESPKAPDTPPAPGGTPAGAAVTIPEVGSQEGDTWMPWEIRQSYRGCDGYAVVNETTGEVEEGGCHPTRAKALAHQRALYKNVEDATAQDPEHFHLTSEHFAEVDNTAWDANAAMGSCSDAACYRAICAGRKAGPADQRNSWALPHHKSPGSAPNARGVTAALGRFSSTQGLTNAAQARSHLEAHQATIRNAREEAAVTTTASTEGTEDLAKRGGDGNGGGCPPGQAWDPEARECRPTEATAAEPAETLGGKPNPGTDPDKRLTDNKRKKRRMSAATESKIEATGEGRWEGILVIEGIPTGDGREFAPDSLVLADFPLPLTYQPPTHGGQPGSAVDVGVIDEAWRDTDNPRVIRGRGRFDMADPAAADVYRKVTEKFLRGMSVDIDDIDPATDVELVWPDGLDVEGPEALLVPPSKRIFHKGRVRGAALLSMPAFVEAQMWAEGAEPPAIPDLAQLEEAARAEQAEREKEQPAVTAAANALAHLAEHRPPRDWFDNPKLGQPCPVTVTADGRVYGHAFRWDDCHIGYAGECVPPPREDDFPYFTQGEVLCADGSRVPVGQVTIGTGHAPLRGLSWRAAAEHYDNTGSVVADVAIGVDHAGAWVAGAIRPGASEQQVYALRASGQLSGDWRSIGGRLRLVALLGVNVPGFPVPRPEARVAGGQLQALVAAGMLDVGPRVDWERELELRALRSLRDQALAGITEEEK